MPFRNKTIVIAGSHETKFESENMKLISVRCLVIFEHDLPFLAISESTWAAFTAHLGLPFRIFARAGKIPLPLSRRKDLCSAKIRVLAIPAVGLQLFYSHSPLFPGVLSGYLWDPSF